MRVALVSDIHANAVALQAVLKDIDRVGADQIVCLGDVATLGPCPKAVIEMLRERDCRCIMGNHDEFLIEPSLIETYSDEKMITDAVSWCRDELDATALGFVRGFERSFEIELTRRASLLLFHGSPRSHMDDLLATTAGEELDRLLAGHRAAVMAGGHTHIQMLRQHRGTLLVNPGSVGMPFKQYAAGGPPTVLSHAEYAIVEGRDDGINIELKRVTLDREMLRKAAADSKVPMRELLMAQYS